MLLFFSVTAHTYTGPSPLLARTLPKKLHFSKLSNFQSSKLAAFSLKVSKVTARAQSTRAMRQYYNVRACIGKKPLQFHDPYCVAEKLGP